jgi:hypothetical protein
MLGIAFEGLNGENIPVKGEAECRFEPANADGRILVAMRIDGHDLSESEVTALAIALAKERR